MDNFAAQAPFTYYASQGKVCGVNAKIGGINPIIDIRYWGYLTAKGPPHCSRNHAATIERDAFGELVATLLNDHFEKAHKEGQADE